MASLSFDVDEESAGTRADRFLQEKTGDDWSRTDVQRWFENGLVELDRIVQDRVDVVGNAEELGKNVGQDQKDHKNTYTSINGLDKAYERLNELSEDALKAISDYYDNAEFFAKLIEELKNRSK